MKKLFTTLTTIGLLSITGIATPLILASCSSTPNQNNTTKPENKPEDKPTPTPPTNPDEKPTPTPPTNPEEKPEPTPPTKPETTYPQYIDKGEEFLKPPYIAPYWLFAPAKDGKTNYFYKIGKEVKDNNGKVLYTDWYGVASYLPFNQFYTQYSNGIDLNPNNSTYILFHSIMKLSFDFEKDWEKNTMNYLSQMKPSTIENTPKFGEYDKWINTGRQDEIKTS